MGAVASTPSFTKLTVSFQSCADTASTGTKLEKRIGMGVCSAGTLAATPRNQRRVHQHTYLVQIFDVRAARPVVLRRQRDLAGRGFAAYTVAVASHPAIGGPRADHLIHRIG